MCRTVHAVLSTAICGVQMLVRVFMTIILMIENVIRMILQTLYNFISFLLQMLSLIPICVVFLLTARLKCFMCGGGGPCPVNRGGACDCIMSALAIIILFFIFRATGVLDKMFYSIGYAKALPPEPARFVPTPGDITECSRNDTDYTDFTTIELMDNITFELTTDEYGNLPLDYGHFNGTGSHVKDGDEDNYHDLRSRVNKSARHGKQRKTKTVSLFATLVVATKRDTVKSVPNEIDGYEQLTTDSTTETYDPHG